MVDTPMHRAAFVGEKVPNFMRTFKAISTVSVKKYVQCAMNTLGWADHCNGHLKHYLVYLMNFASPKSTSDNLVLNDLKLVETKLS